MLRGVTELLMTDVFIQYFCFVSCKKEEYVFESYEHDKVFSSPLVAVESVKYLSEISNFKSGSQDTCKDIFYVS